MNIYKSVVRVKQRIDRKINLLGNKHQCYICKKKFSRFNPYRPGIPNYTKQYQVIGSDIRNYGCPNCHSNDRERHLFIFFDKLDLWSEFFNKKILHIAPEKHLKNKIKGLNFSPQYFDFIICNHVLEHIPNDLDAMKELYRVLKNDSKIIIQTPYSPLLKKSYEDTNMNTPELRLKYFGQEDHVRVYGEDIFDRFKSVGFTDEIVKNKEILSNQDSLFYGVNRREDLMLFSK